MNGGFSPFHLVFGTNPSLPGVLEDARPALGGRTGSEILATHLNLLHSSRKLFHEAETSERIRRALCWNVRPSGINIEVGALVLFKCEKEEKRKGPGRVIGKDRKCVLIKEGSFVSKVHETRVEPDSQVSEPEVAEQPRKAKEITQRNVFPTEQISSLPENDHCDERGE